MKVFLSWYGQQDGTEDQLHRTEKMFKRYAEGRESYSCRRDNSSDKKIKDVKCTIVLIQSDVLQALEGEMRDDLCAVYQDMKKRRIDYFAEESVVIVLEVFLSWYDQQDDTEDQLHLIEKMSKWYAEGREFRPIDVEETKR